jgi:hypothetical protein
MSTELTQDFFTPLVTNRINELKSTLALPRDELDLFINNPEWAWVVAINCQQVIGTLLGSHPGLKERFDEHQRMTQEQTGKLLSGVITPHVKGI